MNDKLLTLFGFAAKSGKLSFGMNASVSSVCSKKSKLIIICSDISQKSRKEIIFHSEKAGVTVLMLDNYNIKTVSDAVGRSCGILSVNDSQFAASILKAASQGGIANDKQI